MKRNLWPYGILAAFLLFIAGTVTLIVMASTQKEDLVSKSYYEQELRYQSRLDNLKRAAESGASVNYDADGRSISLSLPLSRPGESPAGSIQLYRPSAAGLDRALALRLDARGRQVIDASELEPGLWKVRVNWVDGGNEYELERTLTNSAAVRPARS